MRRQRPGDAAGHLKDFPGPVQAMEFVVNKQNTATGYITAAEAQDLYGCGASGGDLHLQLGERDLLP